MLHFMKIQFASEEPTIEKEALVLVLSLQNFDVYLSTTEHSILVYTDHNPLIFINKMKNHNQCIYDY